MPQRYSQHYGDDPERTAAPENAAIPTEAEAVADIARRANGAVTPYPLDPQSSVVLVRTRNDEKLTEHSLEHHLPAPLRPRGAATVYTPEHFTEYTLRLADPQQATIWADVNAGAVTTVLDDHADAEHPGWREHVVQLKLQDDPDWLKWTRRDFNVTDKLMTQEEFAAHLQETIHTITSPAAATLLEIVNTLQGTTNASFKSGVKVKSGDVSFKWDTSTEAKAGERGDLEVPDEFTIQINPWYGIEPVPMTCMLRYRIGSSGALRIGYALQRPDLVLRNGFEAVLHTIKTGLGESGIPLLYGSKPAAVTHQVLR